MRVTALAGGVGAAKFLRGLVQAMDPRELTVIGNTGDDAEFHGLHVSPDLDIVTYTLAGIVDEELGWGIRKDTTHALDQMRTLGVDAWFTLKDQDLGTHLARTAWLAEGAPLSEITDRIRVRLGVVSTIIPMSDDPVRTKLVTAEGITREFQEYFVRFRHTEEISEVFYEGAEQARPAPGVLEALAAADRIIICPSNPIVSIGPILSVTGIREALRERRQDVFAITPIVQGASLKGPADRLLPVVGAEVSPSGVAGLYTDFAGTFVVDEREATEAAKIEALGIKALVLDTVMKDPSVAARMAREILSARPSESPG